MTQNKLSIYYHQSYNIVPPFILRPLLRHIFDGEKYCKVYQSLIQDKYVASNIQFKQPKAIVSDVDLLEVHSRQYLDSLQMKQHMKQ